MVRPIGMNLVKTAWIFDYSLYVMTDYTSRYLDSCTCCMSFNPPNVSLHCYTTCLFSVLFHGKTTEDSDVKEVDVLVDPCVSL